MTDARRSEPDANERLSQILEGTSVPTFVIDENHVVTHWNRACENLTGIGAEEVIGTRKQWAAFYSTERPVMADLVVDRATVQDISQCYGSKHRVSQVIEGAHEAEDFFPEIGPGGRWLFFTAAPLKDVEGRVIGAIETLQDITERKKAEEALRAEKEKAQRYLDVAGVMMVVIDTQEHITLINRRGCEILGYSEQELLGQNWFETCIPKRNRERARLFFGKLIAGEPDQAEYFESLIVTRDGEERIMAWHNTLLNDDSGKTTGVLRSGEDLTEWRAAEEKAREAETLRELDRLRSELLANVSHELRTPLTIITACASMLLRRGDMLEPQEKDQYLESIERSASSLAELVDNLLDLSRLETGMLKMEKAPVDPADLLREVAADAPIRAPDHRFTWEIEGNLPTMTIDRRRIRQVIDNLIDNAAKYSEMGSEVTVVARREASDVVITVTDHGVGIPPEDLEKVFERMYRIERKPTLHVAGAGLGLAICKAIVEAHGGNIWINSAEGRGTSCSFSLPIRTSSGAADRVETGLEG